MRHRTARTHTLRGLMGMLLGTVLVIAFVSPAAAAPGKLKVQGPTTLDLLPANAPHQGCNFIVSLAKFKDSGFASVTITAHPPTAGGVVGQTGATLGSDGAATIPVSLNFGGIAPHPNQGFHVKIDATAGGKTKHKVVWVQECAAPAPPPPGPPGTNPPGPTVIPPSGGVQAGPTSGTAPSSLPPLIGLVLLAGTSLWMRLRTVR